MLLILFASTALEANVFEKLLMPGPLSEGHKDLEEDCSACHSTFSRQQEPQKCLTCHEEVQADIAAGTGFHGVDKHVTEPCRNCHTDHQGRMARVRALEPTQFDHDLTNFELFGRHQRLGCADCHENGQAKREAPLACSGCHGQDDIHQGELGEACQDCHQPEGWTETAFDHATTGFELLGAHAETRCDSCHAVGFETEIATQCGSCHIADDVHQGSNGDDCAQCHNASSWEKSEFDHGLETGFALRGAHQTATCRACHGLAEKSIMADAECDVCHSTHDAHGGLFGTACDECHSTQSWIDVDLDHEAHSGFRLEKAHAPLPCQSCHLPGLPSPQTTCVSCHEEGDVHTGTFDQSCGTCHNQMRWDDKIRFDHDLTAFPLIGIHQISLCEGCHDSQAFADQISDECSDCHDDRHEGGLGPDCGACHSPNGWELWVFDHNSQTQFELTGQHDGLACEACHADEHSRKPAGTCHSCHGNEDPHEGEFGRNCGRCHTTDNFSKALLQ